MSDPRWTLEWQYGDESGIDRLNDISITAKADFQKPRFATRSASISWLPRTDLPAIASRGFLPHQAIGTLKYGDTEVLRGLWNDPEFGPKGMTSSIGLGERLLEDGGVMPPNGAVQRKLNADELGAIRDAYSNYPPAAQNVIAAAGLVGTRASEGRVLPMVWGAPGSSTHPGSTCVVSDDGVADARFIINATSTDRAGLGSLTATLWGPDSNGDLTSESGLTVFYYTDTYGRIRAYLDESSLSGVDIVVDTGAEYYVSWTGGQSLPGGAGNLLSDLFGASTLPIDISAWQAVKDRLNLFDMSGYIDDEVVPSELALDIMSVLPMWVSMGPQGLRPLLWPWLDELGSTVAVAHFIDGQNADVAGPLTWSGNGALQSVQVNYGWDPEANNYTKAVLLSPGNTVYGASSLSRVGLTRRDIEGNDPSVIKTRWVWDDATAQAIAAYRLRAMSIPRRVVSLMVPRELYGFGGAVCEVYAGMPVLVTVPRYGITEKPGHISQCEWSDSRVRIEVTLRDDVMRD